MVLLRTFFLNFKTNFHHCYRYSSFAVESAAYLTTSGVSKHIIDNNVFLLDMKIDTLQSRMEIVQRMRPRHIDDFVPLLKIKEPVLRDVTRQAAAEFDTIPEQHRIYYFSRELQITPVTVSKYCSHYEPIFFGDFTGIAKKLKILLDYNVDSLQILQSLYVFECAKEILFSRLDKLLKRSCEFKPWYFKLTDEEFLKYASSLGMFDDADDSIDKTSITRLESMFLYVAINVEERKDQEIPVGPSHKLMNRNLQKSTMLTKINGMLSCDDELSTRIYYNNIDSVEQLPPAKRIIELLTNDGIGSQCIQNNSVVLTLPYAQINDNIQLIKKMRPKSIEDFLPLVAVETKTLQAFVQDVNKREINLHPIYVFSEKLNIEPAIVAKHFAKQSELFYYQDFVGMVKKLDVLVAYNVEPMSILRSPQTFLSNVDTLETRLNRFKAQGIEHILSWMVFDDARSKESVARRVEEKTSLGECTDTVDYISKRLNWDATVKEKALKCYPPLVKCSPTKVKNHLDYLLNETHFTINDINSTASVFRTKLDELKLRMNEMASIGLVPRKLYAICLDKRGYLEMVWKFCKKKNCPTTFALFESIEKRVKSLQKK